MAGCVFGEEECIYGSSDFLDKSETKRLVLCSVLWAGWDSSVCVPETVKFEFLIASRVVGEFEKIGEESTHDVCVGGRERSIWISG